MSVRKKRLQSSRKSLSSARPTKTAATRARSPSVSPVASPQTTSAKRARVTSSPAKTITLSEIAGDNVLLQRQFNVWKKQDIAAKKDDQELAKLTASLKRFIESSDSNGNAVIDSIREQADKPVVLTKFKKPQVFSKTEFVLFDPQKESFDLPLFGQVIDAELLARMILTLDATERGADSNCEWHRTEQATLLDRVFPKEKHKNTHFILALISKNQDDKFVVASYMEFSVSYVNLDANLIPIAAYGTYSLGNQAEVNMREVHVEYSCTHPDFEGNSLGEVLRAMMMQICFAFNESVGKKQKLDMITTFAITPFSQAQSIGLGFTGTLNPDYKPMLDQNGRDSNPKIYTKYLKLPYFKNSTDEVSNLIVDLQNDAHRQTFELKLRDRKLAPFILKKEQQVQPTSQVSLHTEYKQSDIPQKRPRRHSQAFELAPFILQNEPQVQPTSQSSLPPEYKEFHRLTRGRRTGFKRGQTGLKRGQTKR
jgi:hypothetical protein